MNAEPAREYFWGITLDKENPTYTWSFDEEDDDSDYLIHTLFLKQAVLGAASVKDERNLVSVETQNFDQKEIKQPIFSLTLGRTEMTSLDVSFGHEVPVIFRLVEGSGPVHISAQQLVEYPDDRNVSQDESELECSEVEEDEVTEETEEESPQKATKKRKAGAQKTAKSKKKGKMEVSQSDSEDEEDDEEDDEEEEESMEEDDEEEEEASSPEKGGKKAKKAKDAPKDADTKKKGGKIAKASPKATKKAKKTAKAK